MGSASAHLVLISTPGSAPFYLADAVVLAAGGHTRLWRRSSSRRDENTGDGMYLALQAGAALADMELVQFHPSGMVTPEDLGGHAGYRGGAR